MHRKKTKIVFHRGYIYFTFSSLELYQKYKNRKAEGIISAAGYFQCNFVDIIPDLKPNIFDIIVALGDILSDRKSSGGTRFKNIPLYLYL